MKENNSKSDSKISSDLNSTIFYQIEKYEVFKYARRGFWNIVSLSIIIGYFLFADYLKQFWPKHIENSGKFAFFVTIIIHNVYFILNNLVMYLIYHIEHPLIEQYKTYSEPWPWNDNRAEWNILLKDTIKTLLINQFIILPLVLSTYYITGDSIGSIEFEKLPNIGTMLLHVFFFLLAEDFSFYWGHRLLHHKKLYPYVHKQHHKYRRVVSIASEYCHPFEMIIANSIPTSLGYIILGKRTHFYTYLVWMILRMTETTDGHSGYEFPWTPFRFLPLSAGQEYHNYHHLNFDGNYSSFLTIWDRICGTTNKPFVRYIDNLYQKGKSADTISYTEDPYSNDKNQEEEYLSKDKKE